MIKIGKDISRFSAYSCHPADKNELREIIKSRIEKEGQICNINDIDTSLISDMSYLFSGEIFDSFNGNISEWNVSNVKYMAWMFYCSAFNGDISNWDVSNVKDMSNMFADSSFNGDISDWDISNVKGMGWMFDNSEFDQDISNWNISKDCSTIRIFMNCPIKEEHKPKALQK